MWVCTEGSPGQQSAKYCKMQLLFGESGTLLEEIFRSYAELDQKTRLQGALKIVMNFRLSTYYETSGETIFLSKLTF